MIGLVTLSLLTADPTFVGEHLETSRAEGRLRGGIALSGSAALGFATGARGFGPGLSAEFGGSWADRYSLAARLTIGTILVVGYLSAGLEFDLALSEHVMLGAGAVWGMISGFDGPQSGFIGVPIKVSWMPKARGPRELGRSGFVLFAEATPGLAYASGWGFGGASGRTPGAPFTIAGTVGMVVTAPRAPQRTGWVARGREKMGECRSASSS
ncbi:MAG: hypothetical protein JNJ54_27175 [Myxococcaceae bacterium]|nr:hypothetical protein [Myxococcaceae bacterium]